MKKFILLVMVLFAVFAVFGLGVFAIYRAGYNTAVTKEEAVRAAWADIDVQLERRYDLIPNLVATVKGSAAHEEGIVVEITESRKAYFAAGGSADRSAAMGRLESAISRLLLLQEDYPDLKANAAFLTLQDQLEGTENRIAVARKRYNDATRDLNTFARTFFGRFFVRQAGVEKAEYPELPREEAREAPAVDFSD